MTGREFFDRLRMSGKNNSERAERIVQNDLKRRTGNDGWNLLSDLEV
jgi:hypothetical protein